MGPSDTLSVRKMREPGSSAGCATVFVKSGAAPLTDEYVKHVILKRMKVKYARNTECD